MNKLIFVCQWARKRERTWSGTSYSILNALQKRYDINVIQISTCFVTKLRNFFRKKFRGIKYDFNYRDVLRFNNSRQRRYISGRKCTFQFTEFDQAEETHSYIYQDMCVQYISDKILTDSELRPYFWKNISIDILEDRKKRQLKFYSRCQGIFVMGQWLKEYMTQEMGIPANRVHCVGAGYDIDISKIRREERDGNKILFVGRDFARKGGDCLLKAFEVYKRDYNSKAELFIAGVREKRRSIEGVHWLGDIGSDELVHYYCSCDILCMPSFLEPFGKAYIEALCCGMPIIALNRFATPDFIRDGHNGYLLDEYTPKILAEKIDELLRNEDIKRNAIEEAEYYQKKYSWDAVAERICRVIDQDEYYTQV